MFPPGLPVGIVASLGEPGAENAVRVQPLEDFSRLEYVRVVDFRWSTDKVRMRSAHGHEAP